MFNPAVTDKTADFMFEGMQNQVRMDEARRVRNDQMLQESVGQAMEALNTAGEQYQQVATKNAAVDGRVHAFEKLSSTNPEIFDPAFAAELVKEPNRGKRAGMLATWEEMLPQKSRISYLNAQTNASANLAAFKESLPKQPSSKVLATDQGLFRDTGSGEPQPITVGGKQLRPKASSNPLDLLFGGAPAPTDADVSAPAAAAAPAPAAGAFREGQKARNASGQMMVFKGGKWEAL